MLVIATSLTVFALLLLVLALRGRIVERGVFCRRCKFNLAGIDSELEPVRCPECGQSINTLGATRTIRRSTRRGMLALAAVLMLIGIGVGAVPLSGNTSSFYQVMPDRVVLFASGRGSDGALDELLKRLIGTNKAPKWVWDTAVEHALDIQADSSIVWDPRWGEIVAMAWQHNRLGERQVGQFIRNGTIPEVWIRKHYRTGDRWIGYSVNFSSSRLTALSRYSPGYIQHSGISVTGGSYRGEQWERSGGGGMRGELTLPITNPRSFSGLSGAAILIPSEIAMKMQAGDEFDVFIEFNTELKSTQDEHVIATVPVRVTQRVTVVDEDESLVSVLEDARAADQLINAATIGPTYKAAGFSINIGNAEHSIAGRVYLRNPPDGELFEMGRLIHIVSSTPGNMSESGWGYVFGTDANNWDGEQQEAWDRITRDDLVDVVFKTDPGAADLDPRVSDIIDIDLIFAGVPTRWLQASKKADGDETQSERLPAHGFLED